MNRCWYLSLGLAIAFQAVAHSQTATMPPGIAHIPPPIAQPSPVDAFLQWNGQTQEVTVTNGTPESHFTFNLTNVAAEPIVLISVHTSCGCTAAKLPVQPWTLPPGTNGSLSVTMNLANKMGTVMKTVTITTDKGPKILYVKSNILPPAAGQMVAADREANQKLALANRQAVFRGDCATCHSASKDKMGKELYVSVCGVCHEAEHRASMVPNLHALSQPTNAEYWRNWITHGKPGTLMPAFSEKEDGILSDAQIESLVKYLTEAIPSRTTTTSSNQPDKTLSRK
jgi:mono/diheme cytochrome c family protein